MHHFKIVRARRVIDDPSWLDYPYDTWAEEAMLVPEDTSSWDEYKDELDHMNDVYSQY